MNQESRTLAQLQNWLQTVISWPTGVEAGLASEDAQAEIPLEPDALETVVTRSSQLTSVERIGIYANAYYARLLECLSEEYPALVCAMGEKAFGVFSMEYLQAYPSNSYTLADLGARFPRFLKEHRPAESTDTAEVNWTDFLIELATLERVYSEVFDGPGIEQQGILTAESLNAIAPEEWPGLTLKMAPCFRLMQFEFPVHEFITQVRKQEAPVFPEPQSTRLAITRRNYVVRREAISEEAFFLLSRLQEGQQVGQAIAALADAGLLSDDPGDTLRAWFKHWTASGYFFEVCRPAS